MNKGSRTMNLLLPFLIALCATASTSFASHHQETTLVLMTPGIVRPVARIRGRILKGDDDDDDDHNDNSQSGASPADETATGTDHGMMMDENAVDEDGGEENGNEEHMSGGMTSEDHASGDGHGKGGKSGRSIVAPTMRMCTTDETKDRVNFECRASSEDTSSTIKDTLSFRVGAKSGDALKIGIKYDNKIDFGNTTMMHHTENSTSVEYTLVYDRIIEYRKNGTAEDDHYEWGVDEVVNTWPLNDWQDLTPVQNISDHLKFSVSDGVASFNFTIAQADSANLTANRMKIDFLLENYPWDASGDTWIALISHVESVRKTTCSGTGEGGRPGGPRHDIVQDVVVNFDPSVNETMDFIPFGEYTWAKTAEASGAIPTDPNATDGSTGVDVQVGRSSTDNLTDTSLADTSGSTGSSTIQVVASTSPDIERPDGSTYNEIAYSFVGEGAQGANLIYWDPEAGVGYNSASSAMARGVGLLASMAVAALIACY